jgi:fatty-acyl-CoA synthase
MARKAAKGLLALGVARGEHVAIWAPNTPEWLFVLFGCAKIGAVAVPINHNFGVHELAYVLKHSDTTVLFAMGYRSECPDALQIICSRKEAFSADSLPALRKVVFMGGQDYPGMQNWRDFLQGETTVDEASLLAREREAKADDIFILQYSSGTTGFPKGAMLSHAAYLKNAGALAQRKQHAERDLICIPLPFYSSYGLLSLLVAIITGAGILVMERFVARDLLQALENWRATAIYGTPTMFLAALEVLARHDYNLSALRGGSISGDYCPPELVRAVCERMGVVKIGIQYGSTETLVTVASRPDDSWEKRVSTIGRAMPDTAIRIVDPQSGREAATGEYGELWVKGPSVMRGYYKSPEHTAGVIDEAGWLHSGDLACADAEGYYRITGRIKDVIMRGGESIYPAEIEEFLTTHPQVLEAKVVGIPSGYYGEEVVAFIRLKPGESMTSLALKRFCRQRIAIHKVPVQFFFVEQYPQTAGGKVHKSKLREMAAHLIRT